MKPIYTFLIAGASALAGGIAGYILCKRQVQDEVNKKVAEAVNEELFKIRESKRRMSSKKKEQNVKKEAIDGRILNNKSSNTEMDGGINPYVIKEIIREQFPDASLNEYRLQLVSQKISEKYTSESSIDEISKTIGEIIESFSYPQEDDSEEDLEEGPFDVIDETNEPQWAMLPWENKPPEVISLKEYTELPPYFDFVTFHYFNEDDVLIDDGDMVVDDVDGTVGDALVCFGDKAAELSDGDDNAVYVVNGKFGLAIEICRIQGSYAAWEGWSN